MPNVAPPEHTDWNTWRGKTDTHFTGLKEGQEKIHSCLKTHIQQTEKRLNGIEQETAVHSTKIKAHWWFIALIVASILGLGVKAAFGTLTDFSFADRDTVIADKETIIYDYHFKIYRTDTVASWAIEVDDYENFACYIEGNTLPHSDSFAIGAVYYQSGTYDSLFSRVPGYERSILDTAITDTIGQWHTFYPLLKYVKIYIYGDTIGTAANPVSTADSNTVRVRVRLSKWKGTQMRIPGTGVHAHHHATFDEPVEFRDSVTFHAELVADTIWLTTLMVPIARRQGVYLLGGWRRVGVGFPDWRRDGLGNLSGWRAVSLE